MTTPVHSSDTVEEPRQIGPGHVPGPLEPIVIDRVEAARQLRKELHERYPGTTFSVRSDTVVYPGEYIDDTDGPPREEVEVIADTYRGWYDDGNPQYDIYSYAPLPGKWVGGQFVRFDIATNFVHRPTSEGRKDWDEIWHQHLAEDPTYTFPLGLAASYLGISARALVKLIQAGSVPATKDGRGKSWLVSLASVKAYREAQ